MVSSQYRKNLNILSTLHVYKVFFNGAISKKNMFVTKINKTG